ncbi:phage tail protein [Nocardia sp. NBC_01009]|uniref:Gp37-like protein n=1 Tax=Nocardia sp. NBC_01009 TaxID=2975996 RepID=UPI00386DF43C|nr:phage tail protein [Nocardia sp. NBC_01009]
MAVMSADLLAECEAIWELTEERDRQLAAARLDEPEVRLWDGDWNMQGWLAGEYLGDFEWVDNDTGAGVTEIPWDSWAAQWIWDEWGRLDRGEKLNVHISVDMHWNGARWTGRVDEVSPEKREDGTEVLVVTWLSDYETVKWYTVWSNSYLPAALQFPRVFMLAGGARWVLLTALFLQIIREQQHWWALPDDPLSPASWTSGLDMSNWSVVVKPHSFMDDLEDGILWSILISRFKNWHDLAKPILEDAELSVVWRRFLPGDAAPIAGQTLRPGALVIDIENRSGLYLGTANGGTLWDGLLYTVAEFVSDFIDPVDNPDDEIDVPGYRIPGLKFTHPRRPYVIWLEGDETGIQRSKITRKQATAVQVVVGGHSMAGVNEAMSVIVNMAGDLIAAMIGVPPIGGALDSILAPIYSDTLLAWMAVKSVARASNSGWSRFFEYFQDGADRAYTLQSLLVLRAGFYATKRKFSASVDVRDGSPWILGEQGKGHCWTGDRVGFGLLGDRTGRIHVDRIKRIRMRYSDSEELSFVPTIGDDSASKDPAQRSMEKLEGVLAGMHDLGVYA